MKAKFAITRAAWPITVSMVLTLLTPVLSHADSRHCSHVFDGTLAFRRLNPTATLSAKNYDLPNGRGIVSYERGLLEGGRFRDLLWNGGRVVDIGGGKGVAMQELAQQVPVEAIVINTQDFSELHRGVRMKGSVRYRVGWAEAELKKIESNSVRVAVDVWGGFSYSPHKNLILEEVYRVLEPGGRAFLLFPSNKSPALVEDPSINYGQPLPLHTWLVKKHPDVFRSYRTRHPDFGSAFVIEINKSMNGEPSVLPLGLKILEASMNIDGGGHKSIFPRVVFEREP